jgi:hypothetical protein
MNTDTKTETPANPLLTTADRCDSCGAQAYVKVTLENGPLLFCGHHYSAHRTALDKIASAVLNTADWIV